MMKVLVLHIPGQGDFIVGALSSDEAKDAWLAKAQQEPGWVPGTTWSFE